MLIGERKLADDLAGIMESKDISAGPNRQVGKCLTKTEVVKNMHRIGAELYAGADLAQLRRLLVDLDVIARLHQTGSRRKMRVHGNQHWLHIVPAWDSESSVA